MASSEDTEITLGTGKLLVLFFGLVGVCALFFALGYSLGRKSEPSLATNVPATPQVSSNSSKASGAASTAKVASMSTPAASATANPHELTTALPSGYFVEVAAVSNQQDPQALVD